MILFCFYLAIHSCFVVVSMLLMSSVFHILILISVYSAAVNVNSNPEQRRHLQAKKDSCLKVGQCFSACAKQDIESKMDMCKSYFTHLWCSKRPTFAYNFANFSRRNIPNFLHEGTMGVKAFLQPKCFKMHMFANKFLKCSQTDTPEPLTGGNHPFPHLLSLNTSYGSLIDFGP